MPCFMRRRSHRPQEHPGISGVVALFADAGIFLLTIIIPVSVVVVAVLVLLRRRKVAMTLRLTWLVPALERLGLIGRLKVRSR